MYRARDDKSGGVIHTALFKLDAQYRTFLDKNFKQHLIICSPSAKYVWQLKKAISNTNSKMR